MKKGAIMAIGVLAIGAALGGCGDHSGVEKAPARTILDIEDAQNWAQEVCEGVPNETLCIQGAIDEVMGRGE